MLPRPFRQPHFACKLKKVKTQCSKLRLIFFRDTLQQSRCCFF